MIAKGEEYDELYKESGLEELKSELNGEVKEALDELGIDPASLEIKENSNENLWKVVSNFFSKRIKRPLAAFSSALSMILIYAVVGVIKNEKQGLSESYAFLCALSVGGVILSPMMSVVGESVEAVKTAGGLMLGFIPIFCMILVSSGRISSAMVYQGAMLGICELITSACTYIISPFVGAYICFGLSAAVSGNEGIYKLAVGIKNVASWILGLLMTVFTGFLGMQSVIAKASDNMTIKTTKFFVGNTVPLVGGALSEAITTVVAGIGMLRSSAMVWCIVAVALIMLPIVLELFLWRITLSVLAAISSMFSVSMVEKLFSVSSVAISFLIALLLCILVMFILSLVIISSGG